MPHSRSGVGWAGKLMDLIQDINPGRDVSMNISMETIPDNIGEINQEATNFKN